jgi:ParB family chromosome partitioning protein
MPTPEDAAVQRMFEEVLGTPVQLTRTGTAIKLTILLYSEEQMQGLYDLMAGAA